MKKPTPTLRPKSTKKKKDDKPAPRRLVADNRKARYNYEIGERFEAGLVLTGPEVKSLRLNRVTIAESYASPKDGEIWLVNADIPEYAKSSQASHERTRPRKLLLSKKQIEKLAGAVQREGMTIVPMQLYFNKRGRAKMEIALGKGKKVHDKRASIKKRDWARDKARLMRAK
jgi:SsrA-binding protein